ncbi:MAG TPA: class I SAM-dependent methyltransferase [Acidimicrobiales bacterium]|nr:class I SAM-dependent methyltransferase [Acidimicrobiales bacterium]
MSTNTLDPTRLEAFAGRMGGLINDGFLAVALSVCHQTGLFDTMAELAPSTSEEIAEAAGLQERYVREVLGALTTGGIVDYDPAARTYALPAEHAAFVTRAAGVNNFAAVTQLITLCAGVEQDVVRCFREGGGVPYSSYPNFQRVLAESTKDTVDATLIDGVLPLVDGLRERLEQGIAVADVGCGSGYAINVLGRAFPNSSFVGYDLSEEATAAGRELAAEWGLTNVRFEVCDVSELAQPEAFDLITTFDAVHDQVDPARVLGNISAALRPGGAYVCIDIAASSNLEENLEHPLGPGLYTISTMHCMTVSLAHGGAGLGTCWGEQIARSMLGEAGFTNIVTHHVEGDIFNVYYICTKK